MAGIAKSAKAANFGKAIFAADIFTARNSDMSEPQREDGQPREDILAGDQLGVRERRMLEVGQIPAAILAALANLAAGRTNKCSLRNEDGQPREDSFAGDQLGSGTAKCSKLANFDRQPWVPWPT